MRREFAEILSVDPWHFTCLSEVVDNVNIHDESSRAFLAKQAETLMKRIKKKYEEHHISVKPYIMLKSDSGTYGMGVMPIEEPEEILHLNRKQRNDLYKGKSSQIISRLLLQEGVPTILNIDHNVSEVCIYQIDNNLVGGFYRTHASKTDRENLNSPHGMTLKKMCPHLSKYGNCGVHHDINIFDIYRILARIAGIAAHREIVQLEAKNASHE